MTCPRRQFLFSALVAALRAKAGDVSAIDLADLKSRAVDAGGEHIAAAQVFCADLRADAIAAGHALFLHIEQNIQQPAPPAAARWEVRADLMG